MAWLARPRVAAGPVRVVKADVVGQGHVRAIVAGDDGRSIKTIAFRQADGPLGAALLGAAPTRRLWVAGRAKLDDWGSRRPPRSCIWRMRPGSIEGALGWGRAKLGPRRRGRATGDARLDQRIHLLAG
jgi:single-stranded-DNA-specific exonuclease